MPFKINQFEELKKSVERITGTIIPFQDPEVKKFEEGEGLDINRSDILSTNEDELFVVLEDGSIRKSIIHIVDITSWPQEWRNPRFHIYKCEKIQEKSKEGEFHRYKISGRKDKQFLLIRNDEKWYKTLEICWYCLKLYNKKKNCDETKESFPFEKWIKNPLSGLDLPKVELDICTIPNIYTESWSKISKKLREQKKYLCERCGRDFSNQECKKFLHVHHIDSDKRNNTRKNLKVLCIECHSDEFNHSHIKQGFLYKEWLKIKKLS